LGFSHLLVTASGFLGVLASRRNSHSTPWSTLPLFSARGMTQMALAKKMKMKQAYIAQMETGKEANPTLYTLRRLARALRCKVSELVE